MIILIVIMGVNGMYEKRITLFAYPHKISRNLFGYYMLMFYRYFLNSDITWFWEIMYIFSYLKRVLRMGRYFFISILLWFNFIILVCFSFFFSLLTIYLYFLLLILFRVNIKGQFYYLVVVVHSHFRLTTSRFLFGVILGDQGFFVHSWSKPWGRCLFHVFVHGIRAKIHLIHLALRSLLRFLLQFSVSPLFVLCFVRPWKKIWKILLAEPFLTNLAEPWYMRCLSLEYWRSSVLIALRSPRDDSDYLYTNQ